MLESFYLNQLYPLQDEVLQHIALAQTDFYLTGGTALSRFYLHHRYSDDLDFFLNNAPDFPKQVDKCLNAIETKFMESSEAALKGDSFSRCFVKKEETILKIEFVNDVAFRAEKPQKTNLFPKTDSISNIISNKICALSRDEAKDWADIWHIALNFSFSWKEAIENAQKKDSWVDETEVLIKLRNFDLEKLHEVKWIEPFDLKKAERDRDVLLKDVLLGSENSLCKKS